MSDEIVHMRHRGAQATFCLMTVTWRIPWLDPKENVLGRGQRWCKNCYTAAMGSWREVMPSEVKHHAAEPPRKVPQ